MSKQSTYFLICDFFHKSSHHNLKATNQRLWQCTTSGFLTGSLFPVTQLMLIFSPLTLYTCTNLITSLDCHSCSCDNIWVVYYMYLCILFWQNNNFLNWWILILPYSPSKLYKVNRKHRHFIDLSRVMEGVRPGTHLGLREVMSEKSKTRGPCPHIYYLYLYWARHK